MDHQVEVLNQSILQAESIISKCYMSNLSSFPVVPMSEELIKVPLSFMAKLKKITSISYNKKENNIDKLTNVYNVLMDSTSSIIYIIDSDGESSDFYIGVKDGNSILAMTNGNSLESAFLGNFPGSSLKDIKSEDELLEKIFYNPYNNNNFVVSVSGIAALKNEPQAHFIQGMENLLDSMKGQKFSVVFISDAVNRDQMKKIRQGYEDLYSQLSPFASIDITMGYNQNYSESEGVSEGISEGITESLSVSQGVASAKSISSSKGINNGRNIISSALVSFFGGKTGSSSTQSVTDGKTLTEQNSSSTGKQYNTTKQNSKTETFSKGSSGSMQLKMQNKTVTNILERIDQNLKRLKDCEDLGTWNCGAYFIAEDKKTAMIAANTYKSLMRGKNSSAEPSFLNLWEDSEYSKENEAVIQYLKKLTHPQFSVKLQSFSEKQTEEKAYETIVNAGSLVSGSELAILLGLPQKSLQGLPVMEFAAFGRDVISHQPLRGGDKVFLGNIFHMGAKCSTRVNIDLRSLTMHTFITGTTGAGKSNTVYHLLKELMNKKIKFLIIEPAKGEYKNIFGGREDVQVFGTNSGLMPLLKINPFVFSEKIHVLVHINKLMEIFNACWSMYAAMPSILKQALVICYEDKGWDLEDSINYSGNLYPDFTDLLRVLPRLIAKSDFSEEVKSNYVGSLVERVKGLTEGIEKTIFLNGEIKDKILFDENCIIDLSNGLSSETKSLIMGLLVMKMQEYRISCRSEKEMNSPLSHITVLEEAHNLLRKMSIEQAEEGTNVQGKAVEMLSNAVAEMRTFGEGFIIVDQSPADLNEAAIRNTNTKIIHRTVTEKDYLLVGKASGINEEQISEIPKLEDGVCAVYQNNWLQPVLCHVPYFADKEPYLYKRPLSEKQTKRLRYGDFVQLLLLKRCGMSGIQLQKYTPNYLEILIDYFTLQKPKEFESAVNSLKEYKQRQQMKLWETTMEEMASRLIINLIPEELIFQGVSEVKTMKEFTEKMLLNLRKYLDLNGNRIAEYTVIQYLLAQKGKDSQNYQQIGRSYLKYIESL